MYVRVCVCVYVCDMKQSKFLTVNKYCESYCTK